MRPTTDEGTRRLAAPPVTGPTERPAALGLLKASHPVPATTVTVLAALLAAAFGLDLAAAATAVAAVAAGQLSIGWCNDRLDLRRDRAAGRRDKPLATGAARPGTVGAAACTALLLCVPLSLGCGLLAGAVHLGCVAAGWTYNLWLKRSVLSWLPYAVAFGLLPAFLTLALPGRPWPPLWLTAAAALLGTGAHFANVLPDIEEDLAGGVRGLPQRLGRRGSMASAAVLALASCLLLTAGPTGRVSPAGAVLIGVTLALCAVAVAGPPALLRGRLPFAAVMAMAGLDAVLLVVAGSGSPAGQAWP
ncbi:UbiA family prenyltransferase [Streptomyces sp. NPDC127114]|uniref:UbiA family prenyltransferase n=1 Tax=Streptomyces sp. NPDC127114 TaxID=3345366 RepID=UPI00362F32A4